MRPIIWKINCQVLGFTYILIGLIVLLHLSGVSYAGVTLVNMIPNTLSDETNQDSEPNLTINPICPVNIAGSAFTPGTGFCPANRAPIFVSTNGGLDWDIACSVPSDATGMTSDITLRFGKDGCNLYAGILRRPGNFRLNILRSPNFAGSSAMEVLVDRNQVDQPYVATSIDGDDDRVYVGDNDFAAAGGRTATIDQSFNANADPVTDVNFVSARIESRATGGQDGPPIRVAVHNDGTVYAAFYRITNLAVNPVIVDLVVVRDDNGGTGANPYTDLMAPAAPAGDGLAGIRIVQGISVPFNNFSQPGFGQERFVASNISIATDPRNSATVYVAWADRVGANDYTLHVRRSQNSGVTWSNADLYTVTDATNPALAINSSGKVGFLYQQLAGRGTINPRWETHFVRTTNAFQNTPDLILADVPANNPAVQFIPYIGDYVHLLAHEKTFYGIFSANNTPDNANFPNGVIYQRNADFTNQTLMDVNNAVQVAASIDPFFFKVTEDFDFWPCWKHPRLCDFDPDMGRGWIELECLVWDCRVIDPLPKNCLLKYGGVCPGCEGMELCPPYYHIFIEDVLVAWDVTLVDRDLNPVNHKLFKTDKGVVISFRPSKDEYINGLIGQYSLAFRLNKKGVLNRTYRAQTRVEVSDGHYIPK